MSGITLDWTAIRPLNGGREKGFEELCSQLARAEAPDGARFVRKGTPDAGVECYAVLADGTEWGWQSKYFDSVGDSQWKQLDESVEAAIEKHPQLSRYYVCVRLDLADARIVGKKTGTQWKSAKDQWDEHVSKWGGWAQKKNRTIEFVWWGSSEMLERLTRTENVGRVRFWFDKRGFDGAWFSARLDEAIRAAGPRYTPEIHVELPIAEDLDAFGRTQRFFNRVKALAIPVREALQSALVSEHSIADAETAATTASLSEAVQTVLNALGAISQVAAGLLPFTSVVRKIEATSAPMQALAAHLAKRATEYDAQQPKNEPGHGRNRLNPLRERGYTLRRLERELREASEALRRADELAARTTLVLSGNAGTGKTHLLCDVVKRRIEAHQPTVLLMGQRFVSNDAPWSQVLQHLDLAGLSAEEFIGALEASAQACGERALIVIDAINEGTGRTIWPTHLAAFLAQVERSPWLGVVLSVRRSYEDVVIPTEVRERALLVTHHGFRKHEYDATKTFFVHYGLELPSTPLLTPEFQNPLFLKTLCRGLNEQGHQRLPRGFHGISAAFNLYLDAVNARLAQQLGYDARTPLVRRGVDAFAAALVDANERWLPREQAAQVVDGLLPNRDFERSLSRGLVVEGVLAEDSLLREGTTRHDVVYLAYERLADHLVAKALLDKVPAPPDWAAAFSDGGIFAAMVADEYIAPGLLEALFIQVAERSSTELLRFAPQLARRYGTCHAFRQSLIWRSNAAFSEATQQVLNDLCRNDHALHETLEVLLTVATIPEHPLNAAFLDRRLRNDAMADRDAWWSTYLSSAWGGHGAVDRLVDWAWAVGSTVVIADDAVDLCGIALAWMLATANRFLRDRATKALVSLYTGRLAGMVRLVDRFADVDDPYVAERIYSVAYGVAMRCHDADAVDGLATSVYRHVFASGSPPSHILLRDYARGVVERALHLGSPVELDVARTRPPYKSTWPSIPSEEDIKPLLPNWSEGSSSDSRALEWARNRIGTSVMEDDFARYVIGTNSSWTNWLAIPREEPPWQPPPRTEDQLRALLGEFSSEESSAWEEEDAAVTAFLELVQSLINDSIAERREKGELILPWDIVDLGNEVANSRPLEVAAIQRRMERAKAALQTVLTKDHAQRLEEIRSSQEGEDDLRRPLRFDLRQIQRYILWRVFDLGWTIERFGQFDRFVSKNDGREASKVERIGKKYQWIAYHEIMAFVADHFQYRELNREEHGDHVYEGPWQENLRDIDPSCTIPILPGGTSWDGHTPAWWEAARYDSWEEPRNPQEWVMDSSALPNFEELLVVTDPANGSRWLNCEAHFSWMQQPPPDCDASDIERRELWYMCTGFLLRAEDTEPFLKWAESVDFWGRWMPDAADSYRTFLGEHAWAPADRYFQTPYHGERGWKKPREDCPVKVRTMAFKYSREHTSFDSSLDDSYELRLPIGELVTGLGLHWTGNGADFLDQANQLAAQDPTVHAKGPDALLIRENILRRFLAENDLTVCWTIIGEKRILGPTVGFGPRQPSMRMSGAYVLGPSGLVGFINAAFDDAEEDVPKRKPMNLARSGM